MAFGEAVRAKTFDLAETPLGKVGIIAVLAHALEKAVAKLADIAVFLEGGQRAAEAIGFFWREARADDGDLHGLFLKQRHAHGLAQHLAQRVGREGDFLFPVATADIGVNHVALDRAGADDGDLDHQVIEGARLHAGQEVHLRAGFDLKHANAVGLAEHVIDGGVLGRQRGELVVGVVVHLQEVEGFSDAGEHAEGEDIDFEDAKAFDVVLVPADDSAVFHRGVLDGDKLIKATFGHDEAADMLAEVAWEALYFGDQLQGQGKAVVGGIKPDLAQLLLGHAGGVEEAPKLG